MIFVRFFSCSSGEKKRGRRCLKDHCFFLLFDLLETL